MVEHTVRDREVASSSLAIPTLSRRYTDNYLVYDTQEMDMRPGIDYIGISTPFYCNDGNGLFLFHKRSVNCRDEVGKWDTGGGKLEKGLSLEENVLKEVSEEYGCQGVIQEGLPPFSLIRNEGKETSHWIIVPYFVLVRPSEVRNNEPHKIEEIGWYKMGNFPHPLHPGIISALQRYKNFFLKRG